MTPNEIYKDLEVSGKILVDQMEILSKEDAPELVLKVAAEAITDLAPYLRDAEILHFNSLMLLSGLDLGEELQVVYHLFSMNHKHKMTIKVHVPKDNAHVPTVSKVWPTANWHERETFDLIGVEFDGHEDLRRILYPTIGWGTRFAKITSSLRITEGFPFR